MKIEEQLTTLQSASTQKSNCCKTDEFTQLLQQSVETLEDIRIKYGVEKEVFDGFLHTVSAGAQNLFEPKNIDKLYNPLTQSQNNANSIAFIDDLSNQEVTVNLSETNVYKLKEHFGSLEAATEVVKKWYNDAAYGVGYINHDANQDGVISQEEALKLKSMVDLAGGQEYMSIEEAIESEEKQKEFLAKFGFIDNINDFINHSIAQDSNLDGLLDNQELLADVAPKVLDTLLSGEQMDIFAFNELVSQKIEELPSFDYSRIALSHENEMLENILKEV